ncbi:YkgJ family cysteine cluster protein [Oleidesulfovibrio sp.]|uniref:YkgJ family cysteine cluster protein n=1 Tax=Oleidesulfovibrio sp. TaxID=2909707 RepID=UPI003A8399EB
MIDTSCDRCGTCCRKGGPALHLQDLSLIQSGALRYADLVTLRRGELAYDEARGEVIPLQQELIKLRGALRGSWTCMFFMPAELGCRIYNSRLQECRALSCKDTSGILAMYEKDRLTRVDVLRDKPDLLALVAAHEESCPYDSLPELGPKMRGNKDAAEKMLEMVQLDLSFRQVVRERANIPEADMDFLFGRPLAETINRMYGLKVVRGNEGLELAPVRKAV